MMWPQLSKNRPGRRNNRSSRSSTKPCGEVCHRRSSRPGPATGSGLTAADSDPALIRCGSTSLTTRSKLTNSPARRHSDHPGPEPTRLRPHRRCAAARTSPPVLGGSGERNRAGRDSVDRGGRVRAITHPSPYSQRSRCAGERGRFHGRLVSHIQRHTIEPGHSAPRDLP